MKLHSTLNKIFISILALAFFTACTSDSTEFQSDINIKLSNSNNEWMIMYHLTPDGADKIDSVKLDDNGKAYFEVKYNQSPDFFMLKTLNYPEKITFVAENNAPIEIEADAVHLNKKYRISGNESSKQIQKLASFINNKVKEADSLYLKYRMMEKDSMRNFTYIIDSLLQENHLETYKFVCQFCEENQGNFAGIMGLYSRYGDQNILDFSIDYSYFYNVISQLYQSYPNNTHVLRLKELIDKVEAEKNLAKEVESRLTPGKEAPNFILNNPDGEKIELFQFRGKKLILSFWNSTETESRYVNRDLSKLWQNKKDLQDFNILSVSSDRDKLQWVNTITTDGMKWENVIADPQTLEKYNIKDKHRLFIIDDQGIIMAKDVEKDSIINYLIKK